VCVCLSHQRDRQTHIHTDRHVSTAIAALALASGGNNGSLRPKLSVKSRGKALSYGPGKAKSPKLNTFWYLAFKFVE